MAVRTPTMRRTTCEQHGSKGTAGASFAFGTMRCRAVRAPSPNTSSTYCSRGRPSPSHRCRDGPLPLPQAGEGFRNCTHSWSAPYQSLKTVAYGRSGMPAGRLIALATDTPVGKINEEQYFRLYKESIDDPNGFWGREGKRVDWIKPYTKVMNAAYDGDVSIKWYEDGTLNASYNCIDRHLAA